MSGRVIEPGYVEKLLRHAIGGSIEDRPGKPPLDKRDLYVRLARVEKVYPYKQEAVITPFKYLGDQGFGGWYARIAFPFFDDYALITYIPKKKEDGYDDRGYYIVPADVIYALTVAVEGMAEEKGRYIIGFVKREDHELTSSESLYEGIIIEFSGSKVELRDDGIRVEKSGGSLRIANDGSITMENGDNSIQISQSGIKINGDLKINGGAYPPEYILIEGSTEPKTG